MNEPREVSVDGAAHNLGAPPPYVDTHHYESGAAVARQGRDVGAPTNVVNIAVDMNGMTAGRPEGGFRFDGGAGSYLVVGIGAFLLTVLTLGLALPWAICMQFRWRTEHTLINGRRLRFTGSGGGLFGNYIKWWLLTIITVGVYGFWVVPRLVKWTVEHQDFR